MKFVEYFSGADITWQWLRTSIRCRRFRDGGYPKEVVPGDASEDVPAVRAGLPRDQGCRTPSGWAAAADAAVSGGSGMAPDLGAVSASAQARSAGRQGRQAGRTAAGRRRSSWRPVRLAR